MFFDLRPAGAKYLMLVMVLVASCDQNSKKASIPPQTTAEVLLFNGTGTSPNDVKAIGQILEANNIVFHTADADELNSIPLKELTEYKLLIFPGGNFIAIGQSFSGSTPAKIRTAVKQGVHYFGLCAGAFLAGQSSYYNGFDLTSGTTFGFYSAAAKGIRKCALSIANPDGSSLDQYWEDGPQLSGWGNVVARYPDNTAAVAEGKCGKGLVVLTGIHPEAPEYWRGNLTFHSSVEEDNAYALKLIRAALNGSPLPHY